MWQQNRRIFVELANTKNTFLTIILCVSISYTIFVKNQLIFQDTDRRSRYREVCLRSFIYVLV